MVVNNLITGASGFIGAALAKRLRLDPAVLVPVNMRNMVFVSAEENDYVWHLAANTGGIGYVSKYFGKVLEENLALDLKALDLSREGGRVLYMSSACVYPWRAAPLYEGDADNGLPDGAVGWAKRTGEFLFQHALGETVRIARLHTAYGPGCSKVPVKAKFIAALCHKVAAAKDGDSIEIWGSGNQVRSFTYIDDVIDGLQKIMASDYSAPLNLGSGEAVTINAVARMLIEISGKDLGIRNVSGPEGPPYRVPELSRLRSVISWEPQVSLREGLKKTYEWILKKESL
jgi:GDP-D-mannose 3',5'-epimerase